MKLTPLTFTAAALAAAFSLSACKPNSKPGTPPNPDSSFNIVKIQLQVAPTTPGAAPMVIAEWTNAGGDNGTGQPDLSLAKLSLKPDTTYDFSLISVIQDALINHTQQATLFYDAVVLENAAVIPEVANSYCKDYLVRASGTPDGLLTGMFYMDGDQTTLLDMVTPTNIKPVGRSIRLQTGNGTPSTGTLTLQLTRRADKSSLVGGLRTGTQMGPEVLSPLETASLGSQIEDFKVSFDVEVKN